MKKTIIILFLTPVILLAQATNIGYEHFKLGMSYEKIKSILHKNFIKNWDIYIYTLRTNVPSPSNDRIVMGPYVDMGFLLENSNSNIALQFTKGTSGKLSRIEIKTEYEDSSTVKNEFSNIKGIITYKYGESNDGSEGRAGKSCKWKIDGEQYIELQAIYDNELNCYLLLLQYCNIVLNKESHEFLKAETKKRIFNKY